MYRRGPTYYCSDQCMDVAITRSTKLLNSVLFKKRKDLIMNNKITLEMKKKAAQIAIDGGNPLPYLKQHGAKNPSATWQYVRKCLEKADPEMYAKLPDRLPKTAGEVMADAKAAADEFFGKCEDMGLLKAETPETPAVKFEDVKKSIMEIPQIKVDGPIRIETPEGNQVEVIETPEQPKAPRLQFKIKSVETELGTYTAGNKYFEFRSAKDSSDAIEMLTEDFIAWVNEAPIVLEVLGVKR